MGIFNVDIQPGTGFEFKNEVFTVRVEADGFDQAARRGIRRAVARAEEWNNAHPDVPQLRLTDPAAYRVIAVRTDCGGPAPAPVPVAGAAGGATLVVAMDVGAVVAALAAASAI